MEDNHHEYTQLEKNRLEKAARLREQGIEPYPHRVQRSHTSQAAIQAFEALENDEGAEAVQATLVGRIRSMRPMGKLVFAHIEDGAGRIQLFIRANDVGKEQLDLFKSEFDLGDFVEASGEVFRTRTGEISLRVNEFRILAKAITPLPAAKDEVTEEGEVVRHASLTDPETRYRQRYADLAINEEVREIFRVRAGVSRALRDFMDDRGFLEVETPILQPIYGGAAAKPFVTHHNQLKQELYLRISFELYLKRLLVGGYERVYEIGRDFRNEGVDRTHNPEFTQIEFYWAYADYNDVMRLTEEMVRYVAEQVTGGTTIEYQGNQIDLSKDWQRIELKEGLIELASIDIDEYPDAESLAAAMRAKDMKVDPKAPRGKLIDTLIGEFVEPTLIQPSFLYNYPRDISPLAKNLPGDSATVERFEGFMAGFELCNAFTELNDPIEQELRFQEMGRAYTDEDEERHPMDEDYLRAMRYGMPPNGGFGMGVDRLTMLFTDKANIREVILFPHLRSRED
ncbi:MAG: lysine--tRNA ligase [Chloroflexi bacterium]|nr:MAG: lysine--tRNA ligase [Chloroflexota bacterium]MBL1193315.1 lysine--tRNA ligase [Chloroflexota bacterium]NOH10607.1 lysine--tRNA ligase [Chloroflexota bacterium]